MFLLSLMIRNIVKWCGCLADDEFDETYSPDELDIKILTAVSESIWPMSTALVSWMYMCHGSQL